jgi:hypothetical protein
MFTDITDKGAGTWPDGSQGITTRDARPADRRPLLRSGVRVPRPRATSPRVRTRGHLWVAADFFLGLGYGIYRLASRR